MNERVTMTPADALVGRTIDGKYTLVDKLGAGAMGAVYKAIDPSGGYCAVKVMEASAVGVPALRERFEREAKALFALRHPHVIEVRDYGVHAGQPYLVMELLVGRTLEELVVDHTPGPAEGLELAKDLLRGLAFAHQHGVLHRDIKSENVWVSWDGQRWRAKLLDFGLVKFEDDQKWGAANKLTMQGSVFGSPAYMSPEQTTGQPVDARADVYSAGIVLYELITGAWPFEAESPVEMMRMHLIDPVPPLASRRAGLGVRPELEAVVNTALAKRPPGRFPSAVEMLAALEAVPPPGAWLSSAPQPAAAPPSALAAPAAPQAPAASSPPAPSVAPAASHGVSPALLALLVVTTVAALAAVVALVFLIGR